MNRAPAVLLTVLFAVLPACAAAGCTPMRRISESAYRNAVADGAVAELDRRGVELRERPRCGTPGSKSASESVVRVRCSARTADGAPVLLEGVVEAANTGRPRESYVITVGGREVLRQDCLGLGCGPRG